MPVTGGEPRSAPEPRGDRSVARDTAADVADTLREAAQPLLENALSRVAFMVLAVSLVPVGVVIVAAGFVAMYLAHQALGSPSGFLATAITICGLLGILAALFFAFRTLYRRMPRRLRGAYGAPIDRADSPVSASLQQNTRTGESLRANAPPRMSAARLAELDARLAPEPPAVDGS